MTPWTQGSCKKVWSARGCAREICRAFKAAELISGLSALRYGSSSLAAKSDAGRRIRHDKSAQMDRSKCNGNFRNGDFQYCDARYTARGFS